MLDLLSALFAISNISARRRQVFPKPVDLGTRVFPKPVDLGTSVS
jgi:predicted DNA-binding transcriptional regulator AlpA